MMIPFSARLRARSPLLALALLSTAAPAVAAGDDPQLWTGASATVKLSDHWRFSQDVTARFSDHRNGLYEIEMNSLLGYKVSKTTTVWAGYTHDPQYAEGDFRVMEHRAREQVTFDNIASLGRGRLSARIRTEQRWRDGVDGTGWRVRPYVKYTLPLKKGGKTALVLSTEPFFNLNSTPFQRTTGFDRIRNLVALSTPLSSKITAEVGYLNQYTRVRNGPDTDDHVASVSLNLAL
jgi:hypothetical protein